MTAKAKRGPAFVRPYFTRLIHSRNSAVFHSLNIDIFRALRKYGRRNETTKTDRIESLGTILPPC